MPMVLVITGRETCCEHLTPQESSGLEHEIKNSDPWLQSVASLKPEEYDERAERILEKHKSDPIILSTDAPPAFVLKFAFVAGKKNHQSIYLMHKDGSIVKIQP